MVRFKVDEYKVKLKGREYSVLVFPFIKHMWAYDDSPEEYCYMIDGGVEVFSMLKYTMAIMIEASDKILYFPCKQDGIGRYYRENYNVVMCTPKAQLRRSEWVEIRRRLKNATKRSYCLQYSRKKLDDYCMKKLLEKDIRGMEERYYLKREYRKKFHKEHLEEVVGDTLFFVMGKIECYWSHYRIAEDLDEYTANERYGAWTAMGWIITEKGFEHMKEELKKEKIAIAEAVN